MEVKTDSRVIVIYTEADEHIAMTDGTVEFEEIAEWYATFRQVH